MTRARVKEQIKRVSFQIICAACDRTHAVVISMLRVYRVRVESAVFSFKLTDGALALSCLSVLTFGISMFLSNLLTLFNFKFTDQRWLSF